MNNDNEEFENNGASIIQLPTKRGKRFDALYQEHLAMKRKTLSRPVRLDTFAAPLFKQRCHTKNPRGHRLHGAVPTAKSAWLSNPATT